MTATSELREEPIPPSSASLVIGGSGAASSEPPNTFWQESAHANTSRAVFSAFCESLQRGGDPLTGGAPN